MTTRPTIFISILVLLNFIFSTVGYSQVFFLEDWDTTPEVPNELRGWQNAGNSSGQLLEDTVNGFYFSTEQIFNPILFVGTSSSPDFSTWLRNEYVGGKNYRQLQIANIEFEAIHNEIPNVFQSSSPQLSLLFAAAVFVEDPNNPGMDTIPFIWTISEEGLELDGGWQEFQFDIPFDATSPPEGWFVYPDSDENWNLVMQQVDDIRICFCPFQIGIGGIPLSWDVGLDNFTVLSELPFEPAPIPTLNPWGIGFGMLLMGLVGIGWQRNTRRRLQH